MVANNKDGGYFRLRGSRGCAGLEILIPDAYPTWIIDDVMAWVQSTMACAERTGAVVDIGRVNIVGRRRADRLYREYIDRGAKAALY
jgi:hypothetical protein